MIPVARLLGRLGWLLSEKISAEVIRKSTIARARRCKNYNPPRPVEDDLHEVSHGVLKHSQPVATSRAGSRSPPRMLRPIDKPLRMRHQSEHAPGLIANPRDIAHCAIRICRVGDGSARHFGLRISDCVENPAEISLTNRPLVFKFSNTLSSRITNFPSPCATGNSISSNALQENALARLNRQPHPPRFELSRIV